MEQNKISRRNFLRVAGASATAAAMGGLVPAASAAGIKDLWSMDLQILATSDTHGKFDPWDYAANKADASGSVAQQATAIKENRTKTTLVVDAGDTIQANSAELFLNDDVHPMIAAQNAIGYDIYVTGNHEWAAHAVQELEPLLEENGVSKEEVVKVNIWATSSSYNMEITKAYSEFFKESRPCCTWIGIKELNRPTQLVEIEMQALIGAKL